MKATGLTSVVPRCFFVPLNQYGCPKIEARLFQSKVCKKTLYQAGKRILSRLDTLNSKGFTDKTSNHGEGSSVLLN